MEVSEAIGLVSRALGQGASSGGYLVVGDVSGSAMEFTLGVLRSLFPDEDEMRQVAEAIHPDVVFLYPEGASRTIKTETIRDRIVSPMASTSYSGGWKAGVIVGADRMQPAAANVFLKSLEEPTPRTVYFLLTDNPAGILPTIISRCQRVDLKVSDGFLEEGPGLEAIDEVFSSRDMDSVFARLQAAKFLAAALEELKEAAPKGETPLVKKAFYRTIMRYARDWMVGELVPRHLAFRNIEAVEEAYARSERYIPDDAVLSFMLDKFVFPKSQTR